MTFAEILPVVSTLCAVIAASCAVLAARRAGRWRDSDAAQALVTRVQAVESNVNGHDLANRLKSVEVKVSAHEAQIAEIRSDIADLPTRADIARVEGLINQTCAIANRTEHAVSRLQDFLMERRP